MPPDFFNSREDAVLLWAVVLLSYVVYKDPRGIGSAAWQVIRASMAPKLLLLFGSAALYSAGLVLLAERIGLWQTTALKETVYWFIGSAVFLTTKAVEATPNWGYLKTVTRHAVNLALIVAFLVNFYVFPLSYEVVFVCVVGALTLGAAVSDTAHVDPATGRFMNRALILIGLFLLVTFAVRAMFSPGDLFTRETAVRFLVVPVLTMALIPYLLAVVWYSRREMANMRRRIGLQV